MTEEFPNPEQSPVPGPVEGRAAVITRTKDRRHFLERNIQSVLAQTYENFVHVIVNDGGDPQPVDALVEKYAERYAGRQLVVHNETNLTRGPAADAGIQASESEYIVLLDDDDTWEPTFLEEMVKALEDPQLPDSFRGIVCRRYQVEERLEDGKPIVLSKKPGNGHFSEPTLYGVCQGKGGLIPCAFLYRRNVLDKVGGYTSLFPISEDWDFNIRFLRNYDVTILPKLLASHHARVEKNLPAHLGNTHQLNFRYVAQIQNHYLREDLDNNRVGIGFLMNLGHEIQLIHHYALLLQRLDHWARRKIPFLRWLRNRIQKNAPNRP